LPQRLKPQSGQCRYRSGEPLRHPKPRATASFSAPSLGSIERRIEQERTAERARIGTCQARLVLLLQQPIEQGLAGVRLPFHVSALLLQLRGQGAAIVKPIWRAASKAVPGLSVRGAHV